MMKKLLCIGLSQVIHKNFNINYYKNLPFVPKFIKYHYFVLILFFQIAHDRLSVPEDFFEDKRVGSLGVKILNPKKSLDQNNPNPNYTATEFVKWIQVADFKWSDSQANRCQNVGNRKSRNDSSVNRWLIGCKEKMCTFF